MGPDRAAPPPPGEASPTRLVAALQQLTERPDRPVHYDPPEMEPRWAEAYVAELQAAAAAALDAGAGAEDVFALLDGVARCDLDGLPPCLLALCVDGGLSPDVDVTNSGDSLLHHLINAPVPVALGTGLQLQWTGGAEDAAAHGGSAEDEQQQEQLHAAMRTDSMRQLQQRLQQLQSAIPAAASHPAAGRTTLAELLRRGAQPDLPDSSGNTAAHLVVASLITKQHFTDSKAGQGGQQQQPQQHGDPAGLQDNDAARAAWGAAAFAVLVAAGWQPGVRNFNGFSVCDLLDEGLLRYQSELAELEDPGGAAQAAVAELSQRVPDKAHELRQFLATKIAGVRSVVDAMLLMRALAAAAEAPRKQRSVAVLVLIWLLLVVGVASLLWRS